MGFDPPRIAVQVKSSDTPVDVSVLRELQGVMPRFGADQGLIVSWGGFKESVTREARQLYFRIRLWDSGDIIETLSTHYERLPDALQAEIPMRQVWGPRRRGLTRHRRPSGPVWATPLLTSLSSRLWRLQGATGVVRLGPDLRWRVGARPTRAAAPGA
jgi:restriction system protein